MKAQQTATYEQDGPERAPTPGATLARGHGHAEGRERGRLREATGGGGPWRPAVRAHAAAGTGLRGAGRGTPTGAPFGRRTPAEGRRQAAGHRRAGQARGPPHPLGQGARRPPPNRLRPAPAPACGVRRTGPLTDVPSSARAHSRAADCQPSATAPRPQSRQPSGVRHTGRANAHSLPGTRCDRRPGPHESAPARPRHS